MVTTSLGKVAESLIPIYCKEEIFTNCTGDAYWTPTNSSICRCYNNHLMGRFGISQENV